jgi:hypothetical protein
MVLIQNTYLDETGTRNMGAECLMQTYFVPELRFKPEIYVHETGKLITTR